MRFIFGRLFVNHLSLDDLSFVLPVLSKGIHRAVDVGIQLDLVLAKECHVIALWNAACNFQVALELVGLVVMAVGCDELF